MNSLVKELIQPLLEETTKTVALYPGKFKPPHKGHFTVAKQLLDKADEVIIVISPITVDGITAQQSEAVWNLYKTLLGDKIDVRVVDKSPVKYVLDTIKENPEGNFIVAYGKGEEERYKSLVGKPNVKIIDGGTISDKAGNLNATDFRKAIKDEADLIRFLPDGIEYSDFIEAFGIKKIEELSNKEIKYWALYADIFDALKKNPDHMYEILKNKLTGEKLEALEYFYKFIQPEPLQENCGCQHEQPTDFNSALASLTKYMVDNGMNITPLPKLKIVKNDVKNASNILGKTAYYDPNNCSITLYTYGRHPKDILRSFAHEMIHRIQDNEGRLNNINTTNTNEGGDLDQLEREAYEYGNMTLRNWEDSIKNPKLVNEVYFLDVEKFNYPRTIHEDLWCTLNEIILNPNSAVEINGNLTRGKFQVGNIIYEYDIKIIPNPYNDGGNFANISFYPEGDKISTPTGTSTKENYIKILSTMYKIILNFAEEAESDYIGISSMDNTSNKNYHMVYANLTDNKFNRIPGYFRKDVNLPFNTPQGKGRMVVLKRKDV